MERIATSTNRRTLLLKPLITFWFILIAQGSNYVSALRASTPLFRRHAPSAFPNAVSMTPNSRCRGILFSDNNFFSTIHVDPHNYFHLDDDEEDERNAEILSYLPSASYGGRIPSQTRQVLEQLTKQYIHDDSREKLQPDYILDAIVEDHHTRQVPVVLNNKVVDVSKAGAKEFTQSLSLAALYGVPQELTVRILTMVATEDTERYVNAFQVNGWDSVVFPKGLAITPKVEFRNRQNGFFDKFNRRKMEQTRIEQARKAVSMASHAKPPPKVRSRLKLLAEMEEQLSQQAVAQPQDELLFFENSVPVKAYSLGELRKFAKRQYSKLKRKGRAGFLSYCFFNFVFYTIGVLWQWPSITTGSPHASSAMTIQVMLLRKFGRVFASLYIAAQIFKLPKVLGSIAITPLSQRMLNLIREKLHVNETAALVIAVGFLIVTWVVICGVPVLAEYANLRNLVYMEDQLLNLYGWQQV